MAETEDVNPAPEVPEVPQMEVKLPEQPYSKEVMTEISKFFKGRSRYPHIYGYTADGNLEIKEGAAGKKKIAAGNIILQTFVPLEPAERALLDETRLDSLAALDKEFEEETQVLRDAWEEYRRTESMRAVLNSNQRLTEIDARRSEARAQVRDLVNIYDPPTNKIILSDRYEERKMFSMGDRYEQAIWGPVIRMAFYTFPAEVEQGKYIPDASVAEQVQSAEESSASELLYRQQLKDGRYARIFFDTDSDVNGFMSPMWPVEFTLASKDGDSRYSSPIQAYEVERAKELGQTELAGSLMKTRSPRTIRLLTRSLKGHPRDARGLWLKIYTAVYETYPNMKARLLATGSDTLIFADVREGPSSIGIAEKDSGALDPAKWKGENAVGLAQETVRTRSREGTQEEAPQATEVANAVITEEEQAKAKKGAIINAARRGGHR